MTGFEWVAGNLIDSVAFRLARADELEFALGLAAANWSRQPLTLTQRRRDDGRLDVVVTAIRPIPPQVSILFSEAIHQLRAAVDNTVFHLVEQRHGPLSAAEALAVSMPIYADADSLTGWQKRVVKKVPEFKSESNLYTRIAGLQPFNSTATVPSLPPLLAMLMGENPIEAHPLSLLQSYSNWDKHRAIRAAACRSLVQSSETPFWGSDRSMQPLGVGDTIAVSTPGELALLEVTSAVHIERPDTDVWVGVGAEISAIHRYVADTLIPTLITGAPADGAFPFTVDLTDSGNAAAARLNAGTHVPAHQRVSEYILQRMYESAGNPEVLIIDDN